MTRERLRCVGCEEKVPPERVVRVKGLGNVCMTCHEVIDLVWENEIERVRDATLCIERFLREMERPA